MLAFKPENQKIFEEETAGLFHEYYNIPDSYLKSTGFSFVRNLELANRTNDKVKLDVFEDDKGQKIVLVCVTQIKPDEEEVCHYSCFAPKSLMLSLAREHERYIQ